MIARPQSLRFRPWLRAMCIAASLALAAPSLALADDTAPPDHDARLDGYAQKTVLDSGGTASVYIVMFFVGAIGLGVMFIKGKRTHLD
jgi:hypothetical protein